MAMEWIALEINVRLLYLEEGTTKFHNPKIN
jgi:hypothetical protein